jgi:hypothetical protein
MRTLKNAKREPPWKGRLEGLGLGNAFQSPQKFAVLPKEERKE